VCDDESARKKGEVGKRRTSTRGKKKKETKGSRGEKKRLSVRKMGKKA